MLFGRRKIMQLFDLHCDTLYEAVTKGKRLSDNDLQVSFKKGEEYRPWVQSMAVWIPDKMRGAEAFDFVAKCAGRLDRELAGSPYQVIRIGCKDDLEKVRASGLGGVILTVEGGAALAGKLENVKKLAQLGVKMMTLTWNGRNELGGGALVEEDAGITPFGKAAVAENEKYGIINDVSHASDALFWDVAQCANKPFAASHSNARAICRHPRNLTDRQFMVVKNAGGIVGINFSRGFLKEDGDAALDDIIKHTEHFLSLGGEDVVCIGSDFDGTDLPDGMDGIEGIGALYNSFLRHNYKENLLKKIFFDNACNFFESFDNRDFL